MSTHGQEALRVDRLSKTYRRRGAREDVHALKDLTFTIWPGEVVALLGPNGAGKTTAIKCICQLITPSSGRIAVMGVDTQEDACGALAHVAATLDGSRNVDMRLTVRENMEWFAGLQGISRRKARAEMNALLEIFRLTEKRDAVAQTLSRGTVQRVAIACCLMKRASVILLDEPTLGLDLQSGYELRSMIKRLASVEGKTVLVSSHDMATVEDVCARALVMRRAELVADDTLASLVARFSDKDEYEVTLAGEPTESIRSCLLGRGLVLERRVATGRLSLRVGCEDDGLYRALEAVRASGARLESVVSYRPAIEDVLNQLLQENSECRA